MSPENKNIPPHQIVNYPDVYTCPNSIPQSLVAVSDRLSEDILPSPKEYSALTQLFSGSDSSARKQTVNAIKRTYGQCVEANNNSGTGAESEFYIENKKARYDNTNAPYPEDADLSANVQLQSKTDTITTANGITVSQKEVEEIEEACRNGMPWDITAKRFGYDKDTIALIIYEQVRKFACPDAEPHTPSTIQEAVAQEPYMSQTSSAETFIVSLPDNLFVTTDKVMNESTNQDKMEKTEAGMSSSVCTQPINLTENERNERQIIVNNRQLNNIKRHKFTGEQKRQILELFRENPQKYYHDKSRWTYDNLAKIAVQKGIAKNISRQYVQSLLIKHQFRPPKFKRKPTFTNDQENQIVELSRENPQEYNHNKTRWTYTYLATIATEKGIVKNISHSHVRLILTKHNASQSMKHYRLLTEEQKCRIIELLNKNPQNYDPTLNQWTCPALVKIIKEESIEENSYKHLYDRIYYFLKSTGLLDKVTT